MAWAAVVAALLIELSPVLIPVGFIAVGIAGLAKLFR